ncbi:MULTISPECIES: zinc-binding alcohol dehydrogenase family protein [Brucella/Ochrobactrum group]|uniref:Alcohol dehydrogenase zinc-binding domain protein n=1 Tax=Brucella anthropi (strain ATCC 49188 / DSM 6882 / CCUG 24695 / JCM 21032 / LMG 3331 / NBRC 15819 / NCTC 12168 / Alc 37) TaxID=439375 RepID=A6X5V4_BRUA4|nr:MULTISPECIES: zinc-binding alcohol dehydrogenase family protein [Brucella/Ochrobactrum group]ABS16608.1 Alcohol dehydrogenase zinc-binding domain protein [Brucella anthropi ATCC 49188]AIK42279.1 zinc-binding dehydrogenase family protein [Brucella anthropi]KAB2741620.1 zinc-binding alcohol dehydrogenase family protein [Brucella anthropi]KAB2748076.1 zinc-binding alcohol dehydrogenase family protein [Brucella anthropi]KAB2754164.1 zinc-binding alcohol dehydrogenase family protein [Brucella an
MVKALRIESENVTRFAEIDEAPLLAGQVRVRVRHVGLCGSDLNTFKGLNPLVQLPRIPGHEIGGEIMETGEGVSAAYVKGKRVIVLPYTNCGECSSCRKGRLNACRYNKTLGVQQNGGLADQIVLPAEKLILNETLSPRHLALVEPLSVGFHAVERGRVQAGDTVAVLGCGMIGMGVLIGALARGAKVIAIDPSAEKRELALQFGATHALPGGEDVVAKVQELTNDDGVDVAFEAVGLPITFTQAVDLAGFAGRVVYVGYSKAPVTYQTQFFNLKELDIMGSRNATLTDFEAVIAHLEKLGTDADKLISKVFPFDEAEAALPYWDGDRNVLKIIIERD